MSDNFDDGYFSSFDMDIIELFFVMSCPVITSIHNPSLRIMNATYHNHEPAKL